MTEVRFDYRDIFRSARLAFSFQRLWIQFVSFIIGWAGYVVFTYLSLLAGGNNLGVVLSRYGLVPGVVGLNLPWYSWVIFSIGAIFMLFFWLVGATGVARATYMHLKGNTFYTWKEAFVFALKTKGGSVISTPVAITAIAFFTCIGGLFIGLLGRIPYIGELGISLFTLLWFGAACFVVFIVLAIVVSMFLTPSILATTDDDAFEGMFQSFSVLYGQPWRFIVYEILLLVVVVLSFGVVAFFVKETWLVMNQILIMGMGDKFVNISYGASYQLQSWIYPVVAWVRAGLGDYSGYFFFSRELISLQMPMISVISSWIMGIFLLFIGGLVISYPMAVFNAGNTIIFLALKKKKDGENLLERKDREEEEEEELSEEEAESGKEDNNKEKE
ncbi:hypothetical protein J7K93_12185 [bacterium]|nr:hypothetical protein [bacterium]